MTRFKTCKLENKSMRFRFSDLPAWEADALLIQPPHLVCDSTHSWRLYSDAPLGDQAARTMTWYPTQSLYLDTEPTSLCSVIMRAPCQEATSMNFQVSMVWQPYRDEPQFRMNTIITVEINQYLSEIMKSYMDSNNKINDKSLHHFIEWWERAA